MIIYWINQTNIIRKEKKKDTLSIINLKKNTLSIINVY